MFRYLIEFEMHYSNHRSRTMFRTHEAQDNVIPETFFSFCVYYTCASYRVLKVRPLVLLSHILDITNDTCDSYRLL
jgi:hypothetical protein